MLQTGEVVRTLRRSGSDLGGSNSLQWVEGLIADADNSKQVSLSGVVRSGMIIVCGWLASDLILGGIIDPSVLQRGGALCSL